jgi:Holliday junction resolvase RusA-like endonuclease
MKLTIPGTLPSLNEMINASKRNKYAYVKLKDEAIKLVAISAKLCKIPLLPNKYDYSITWYCPNKRKDKDNVMCGQKYIFDGLQEAGHLDNDGWNQLGVVTHRFEVDNKNPRIEIEIVEVSA